MSGRLAGLWARGTAALFALADAAALSLLSLALRLLPFWFRGRWGRIPPDLPMPRVLSVDTPHGSTQVLVWHEGREGLPTVCLHGLNSNPWLWGRAVGCLTQHHPDWGPIYALPMPGHGLTGGEPAAGEGVAVASDIGRTAEAMLATLSTLEVPACALVGHSWGGKVALAAAALAPHRVRAVVLCDPVPPQGVSLVACLTAIVVRLAFRPERRSFPDQRAWEAGRGHLMHMGRARDPLELQLWQGMYRPGADGKLHPAVSEEVFWGIVGRALTQDICSSLAAVQCPVLCLQPDLTVAAWPGATWPLRRHPTVRFHRVAGDHAFVHSNPLDTADLIAGFLAPYCEAPSGRRIAAAAATDAGAATHAAPP